MTIQNYAAIVGMLAIVVTCYALRNSESHYLPDLLALALALATPRQFYAIGAVALLAIVRHTGLSVGLAAGLPDWLIAIALPGARHMSISAAESIALESAYKERVSAPETNLEIEEIPQPVPENREELICLGETMALARLVAKEAIKLTVAVQIGAKAKSGAKYQRRTKEIQKEVEKLRNHFPPGSKRYE